MLRGVNDAKFRRQVVPGDRVRLEVVAAPDGRGRVARLHGVAYVGEQVVAEADLLMAVEPDRDVDRPDGRSSAPGAVIGEGTAIGAARRHRAHTSGSAGAAGSGRPP